MEAVIVLISGHVQGVGFRWFTERQALALGVQGYVRNLTDGRVEVMAQAESVALTSFCERLRAGPGASRVDDVDVSSVGVDTKLTSFRTKF